VGVSCHSTPSFAAALLQTSCRSVLAVGFREPPLTSSLGASFAADEGAKESSSSDPRLWTGPPSLDVHHVHDVLHCHQQACSGDIMY